MFSVIPSDFCSNGVSSFRQSSPRINVCDRRFRQFSFELVDALRLVVAADAEVHGRGGFGLDVVDEPGGGHGEARGVEPSVGVVEGGAGLDEALGAGLGVDDKADGAVRVDDGIEDGFVFDHEDAAGTEGGVGDLLTVIARGDEVGELQGGE